MLTLREEKGSILETCVLIQVSGSDLLKSYKLQNYVDEKKWDTKNVSCTWHRILLLDMSK